jgi:hypothetical protein
VSKERAENSGYFYAQSGKTRRLAFKCPGGCGVSMIFSDADAAAGGLVWCCGQRRKYVKQMFVGLDVVNYQRVRGSITFLEEADCSAVYDADAD